jgi:hypothetical protein
MCRKAASSYKSITQQRHTATTPHCNNAALQQRRTATTSHCNNITLQQCHSNKKSEQLMYAYTFMAWAAGPGDSKGGRRSKRIVMRRQSDMDELANKWCRTLTSEERECVPHVPHVPHVPRVPRVPRVLSSCCLLTPHGGSMDMYLNLSMCVFVSMCVCMCILFERKHDSVQSI